MLFQPQLLLFLVSQQMVQFSGMPTLQKSYRMRKVHVRGEQHTNLSKQALSISGTWMLSFFSQCVIYCYVILALHGDFRFRHTIPPPHPAPDSTFPARLQSFSAPLARVVLIWTDCFKKQSVL